MEISKKEETQNASKRPLKTSDLLIAFGVGITVAAAAATTVYFVKTQRKNELKALKYGNTSSGPSYTERLYSYWGLTVQTFSAVKAVVSDFLTPTADKEMSPFVDSKTASTPVHDEDGLEDM